MIHKTAIIDKDAKVHSSVKVGAYSVIGPNVEIGENTVIQSHVSITGNTKIGKGNKIYPFVSFNDPQDLKYNGEETSLFIGDNNKIREYVTINPGTIGGGGGTRRKYLLSRRRHHVAHVFWKKSHGTRERNLGIDRNERESILYSTVQRRTGAIHPGRSQGAPSRNALFTEKVRERRRKQRERKTKHISCDGNPPFFDFAKQESVDDLSQRTREKNPKFTMDVRRRFTRFYFRKPIAFRTRLFYEVFKDIEQIHGEERRN